MSLSFSSYQFLWKNILAAKKEIIYKNRKQIRNFDLKMEVVASGDIIGSTVFFFPKKVFSHQLLFVCCERSL